MNDSFEQYKKLSASTIVAIDRIEKFIRQNYQKTQTRDEPREKHLGASWSVDVFEQINNKFKISHRNYLE